MTHQTYHPRQGHLFPQQHNSISAGHPDVHSIRKSEGMMQNNQTHEQSMYKPLPFVKRFMRLDPRRQGYSTALSAKYWDWSGLRDNHGQHTVLLLVYS